MSGHQTNIMAAQDHHS